MAKCWTEEEIDFLKEWYPTEGAKACAEVLDRSHTALRAKASKLGISSNNSKLLSLEDYKNQLSGRPLQVLGKYIGAHKQILHQCNICLCTWKASPDSIKRGSGCPHCVGNIKWDTNKYKKYLKHTDYKVLEPYITAHIKILHEHIICGHKWLTSPHSIKSNTGCPKCFKSEKYTTEEYIEQLHTLNSNYVVLGEYINNSTPILHKHKDCGHEWKVCPSNIKMGRGCPKCAISGFQIDKPAYTYFIYFKDLELHKIGITNNLDIRLKVFGYTAEILISKHFKLGQEAKDLEQELLKKYSKYLYNSGELTSGNTETLFLETKGIEQEILNELV